MNKDIERRIIIGMITSSYYIKEIRDIYNIRLIQSVSAKRLASWCINYYDEYGEAPRSNLEGIYYEKMKNGIDKDTAEDIAEILNDLDEEFSDKGINTAHLIAQTKRYFTSQRLTVLSEQIQELTDKGDIEEAEKLTLDYKQIEKQQQEITSIDLGNKKNLKRITKAFQEANEPLFTYPKALGKFWNDQLVRGGLFSLMSIEKRGKTFMLMDMALRASRQKIKVAFFQAGDMNENSQIRRFCINLAQKSDKEKYCSGHYQPVVDCIHNQRDTCNRRIRESNFGVFEDLSEKDLRKITQKELVTAYREFSDYEPCHNCKMFEREKLGVPWLKYIRKITPLQAKEATDIFEKYFVNKNRNIHLTTYPNGTLSVKEIERKLREWEREGIIIDMIVIDYADILTTNTRGDFRHVDNQIWKELRSLSQKKNKNNELYLVITATQADADAYDKDLLSLKNFSENKRKYGHVTAMYGLNQDKKEREKEIGIMRINEIILREGDYNNKKVVHVLQNLKRGRPYVGSYF